MRIKKFVSCMAGAVVGVMALAGPTSASSGSQTFTEVIRANLTPSGPAVTFSQATAGGLVGGIGAVSLDGLYTLKTLHPSGSGTFSLGATTTKFFVPVDNSCETVLRSSGTFKIVMGSGTGAFAGAMEDGNFSFQQTIIKDRLTSGKCAASGHLYISLQATGVIKFP